MRLKTFIASITVALLATIAHAQNVTYDFDTAADFSKFRTYAWVRGTPVPDELNHKRIVRAIDAQLASKGLVPVGANARPDVLVAYHASFDRDLQIDGSGSGGYRFGPGRSGSARVQEILTAALAVDLVDAQTGTIVWRGIASRDVDGRASAEKRERNVNKAAAKLFAHYPPAK